MEEREVKVGDIVRTDDGTCYTVKDFNDSHVFCEKNHKSYGIDSFVKYELQIVEADWSSGIPQDTKFYKIK